MPLFTQLPLQVVDSLVHELIEFVTVLTARCDGARHIRSVLGITEIIIYGVCVFSFLGPHARAHEIFSDEIRGMVV